MPEPADLIITQARCFTADPANPRAEAVAVRGNRIVCVGSAEEVDAWRGPHTRVVDGQGRTLMPGFIDSHFHLLSGSIELDNIQLSDVRTLDDLAAAVHDYADRRPDRLWLAGAGLPYQILPDDQPLTRHHLDAILADRPLIVFAYDAHTAWANTQALRRAHLLQAGKVVAPNSEIVLGPDGLASGELRESGASGPILDLIPEPSAADRRTLLRQGLRQAAEWGVTSVHNMDGDAEQLMLYAALEDLDELTLRVYVPYSVKPDTPIEALAEAAALREMHRSEMVRGGCVKFFMDGVIESYTALVLDDYADRPGHRGAANFSAEHFTQLATEADRLGLQIFVHAIGDAAVRRTLDGFQAAQRANGRPLAACRHRVEHIELIHPDDLPRFAELGVIASMQPLHAPLAASGSDVWPARVGSLRWDRSFAWRSLREAGARLVFGSDWPVVSQNPLRGVHAALNREPWQAGGVAQRLTLEDTLLAYTRAAAYAEFQEDRKGQLRVGMWADLVLLSADLFATSVETLDQVKPVMTVCDGRVVYEVIR
ncbi:MAG TPA: amidohydrolase [Anaerolineae bacterium]|nr:amidohydrolase [Anaerolineae bacterium]